MLSLNNRVKHGGRSTQHTALRSALSKFRVLLFIAFLWLSYKKFVCLIKTCLHKVLRMAVPSQHGEIAKLFVSIQKYCLLEDKEGLIKDIMGGC